jgi:hypothetical protein
MNWNLALHYCARHGLRRHVADTAAVQCTDLSTGGLKNSVRCLCGHNLVQFYLIKKTLKHQTNKIYSSALVLYYTISIQLSSGAFYGSFK